MKKNTAGQKWRVYAWHRTTGVPATGIAATITATINKDNAGEVAVTDTNPTEVASGYYDFDISQTESNAYRLTMTPTSTSNGVGVRAVPEEQVTIVDTAAWLGALAGKTADTATRTEINATTAGAGYNETTDSQEAIRDRGDAAWAEGSSGSIFD